jgi:hypothetical protein
MDARGDESAILLRRFKKNPLKAQQLVPTTPQPSLGGEVQHHSCPMHLEIIENKGGNLFETSSKLTIVWRLQPF